ncbi:hypothetical protein BCR44DRAFT_48149 [Catenaria anguillulae PL171]|uniref:RING-type domain-containing protein n=1 Tax=Catenaria anguillulae PL171 TaxID=765915 RepID=A0A1Y2HDD2_9FUNG|nr:hypothetical protein BCR44DRAFT_48149 [Catenaria anguillulae PL171]
MSSQAAAHSHAAHSNANSSAATVADELEWIHCNACYCDLWTAPNSSSPESTTGTNSTTSGLVRFAFTQCTHVLCASCLSQASNPAVPGFIQCPICHQVGQYNPLTSPDGSSINPDLAQLFSPMLPQWSQMLSAAEFRQRNIDALIRFLKDKLHLQRQGIERAAKELKSMRQLQAQYQAVVEENQALRMQLEHYLQQQQHQRHSRPAQPPPPPQPTLLMHAPALLPSRHHSTTTSSLQRSHTSASGASLQRPPTTSATRTSSSMSHPVTCHQRSFSRAPSVQPQAPSTRSSHGGGGSSNRLSLSRATTSGHQNAVTPTKAMARAPRSPSGASQVSYSSGARVSTRQDLGSAGYLRRATSTMTASGRGGGASGSRGVRELRSQLRGR